jgi:hypothetical protein
MGSLKFANHKFILEELLVRRWKVDKANTVDHAA